MSLGNGRELGQVPGKLTFSLYGCAGPAPVHDGPGCVLLYSVLQTHSEKVELFLATEYAGVRTIVLSTILVFGLKNNVTSDRSNAERNL